jgi:hypothetical protein
MFSCTHFTTFFISTCFGTTYGFLSHEREKKEHWTPLGQGIIVRLGARYVKVLLEQDLIDTQQMLLHGPSPKNRVRVTI